MCASCCTCASRLKRFYVCMCVCVRERVHVCVCAYMCACLCVCVCARARVCVYLSLSLSLSLSLCISSCLQVVVVVVVCRWPANERGYIMKNIQNTQSKFDPNLSDLLSTGVIDLEIGQVIVPIGLQLLVQTRRENRHHKQRASGERRLPC